MRELFRYEWRTNRRSFVIWTIIIVLFQMMFAGFGDLYMSNEDMLKLLEQFPPALLEGFGLHAELMTSFEGWMASEPLVFYMLLLGAFAAIWAASAGVRERDAGTADFMYTLPLTRGRIFLGKAAAHVSGVLLIAALSYGATLLFGSLFSTVRDPGILFLYTAASVLTALAFAGIGYALSVAVSSERAGMAVSIGIVILSFLFHILAGMHESLSWLSRLSLFTAFNGIDLFLDGSLPWPAVFITIVLYAGGLAGGRWWLSRRDL
ncbi:ABC transporter permease [Paenibacillus thiaminolyticus]|uniref:ABC transporter permease subunit n=1 Tax=Paenibacillus thiaminolyticus TaxID=49283 RepID=UPI00234FD09A|nr:ABC transporter permease subunit [Paenibacillus thiaminolyticus]WCR25100.1 ABC transporter permease [Paenibacillus thiaminolyticus]